MADVKNVSSSATTVKSVSSNFASSTTASTQTVASSTSAVQGQQANIIQDVLNFWPVKFLISYFPFGKFISDILSQITQYIEVIETQVAEKGKGQWKKSIVEDATVKYILQQFPELAPADWILSAVVGRIIDFIVSMKNRYGWNWIPFSN